MQPADHLPTWLWRAVPIGIFGLAWQLVGVSGLVDPGFLPSPGAVGAAVLDLMRGGQVANNLAITLFRAAAGLVSGAIAGVWIGLLMARSMTFRAYVTPLVGGTYSLPKSALVPLFILWFGVGSTTAICAVFLACLLPLIVHTFHGVRRHRRCWSGARSHGLRGDKCVVDLPAARASRHHDRIAHRLGFSFVLAISSEMIAANGSIGS